MDLFLILLLAFWSMRSSILPSSASPPMHDGKKQKKKKANNRPHPPPHWYKLKMERPGHLGQISKRVRGAVIWRCSDRPLLPLSLSLVPLPPSLPPLLLILPSSTLVIMLSAACSTVDTGPAWGPDGWQGWRERQKEGIQKKERFWGVSQACQLKQTTEEIHFYEL